MRVRNEHMPNNCLECFSMRGYGIGIDHGNNYRRIRYFCCISAVAANNSNYFRAFFFCIFKRFYKIITDILFCIATTDRKNKDAVVGVQPTAFSQFTKTLSHPSSFTLAVSSETLSVGA